MPSQRYAGKQRSPEAIARKRLYSSSRWRKLRIHYLSVHPYCVECQREGRLQLATVVDHSRGHAGSDWRQRFFDPDALQSLCAEHHAPKSAREGTRKPRRNWFGAGEIEGRGAYAENRGDLPHRAGPHRDTANPGLAVDDRRQAAQSLIERFRS